MSYAVALLLPVALLGGSAAITVLTGAMRPTPAQLANWPQIVDKFIFMLLFVGPKASQEVLRAALSSFVSAASASIAPVLPLR